MFHKLIASADALEATIMATTVALLLVGIFA